MPVSADAEPTSAAAGCEPAAEAAPGPPSWVVLLLIAGAVGAVYLPALWSAQFLNFDDNLYFGPDNPAFRAAAAAAEQGGLLAGLGVVLDPSQVIADVYLPVAHASLWLDYWWSGSAWFAHLHSLLLHGAAAAVLFFALRALLAATRTGTWLAAAAALAFAVHPALCESVAWVSSRKDVLSGLFVFAALWVQAVYAAAPARRHWLLSAIGLLGALALYSKATAVVLPPLLLLACWYRGGDRRRWLGPAVALAVTLPIAWHHHAVAAAAGTMAGGDATARLVQVPGAFAHYLGTAFWPRNLNVLYPEVQTLAAFRAAVWPASLVLLVLLAMGLGAARRPAWRPAALGLAATLAALLPFNTAFPASVIAAADRYLYLAIPFAALAAATTLAVLAQRPWLPLPLLAVPLGVVAFQRAPAFATSEALWQASLDIDEDNAVAWLNLHDARYGRGAIDVTAAVPLIERAAAAARYPEHRLRAERLLVLLLRAQGLHQTAARHAAAAVAAAEAVAASGRVGTAAAAAVQAQTLLEAVLPLRDGGDAPAAMAALARAEALAPGAPALIALRVVLDTEELVAAMQRERAAGTAPPPEEDPRLAAIRSRLAVALETAPEDPQLNLAAGSFERACGSRLTAIKRFRRAAQRDPLLVEAWLGAAQVCLDAGFYQEADDYARAGIAQQVEAGREVDPRLRLALARAMAGQGRLDDAILHLEPYVQMRPRDRDAARVLSSLWMTKAVARLSDPKVTHAELQHCIDRALAVNPQEPRVDIVRARLLRDRRHFGEAVAALDRVRQALPDYEDAVPMLADNLRDLGYERMLAGDDEAAAAAWRRFLALADKATPTEAVVGQLGALWRRAEQEGIAALQRGDRVAAETAFRRCLRIDPEQHWASWLLASVLLDREGADLEELDRLSAQAVAWQERHGLDQSRQVLLRAIVLRRLQRDDEAKALAGSYLAAPDESASPPVLQLLRTYARDR